MRKHPSELPKPANACLKQARLVRSIWRATDERTQHLFGVERITQLFLASIQFLLPTLYIRTIFGAGITAGCGPGIFCPDAIVTRQQMAVFLLKAEHGGGYAPPPCSGVFADVPCTPGVGFPDWIEQLYAEHVTAGCATDPLRYCPGLSITRAQMAVFLLKTEHGSKYAPGSCTGIFGDVPCPATPAFPFSDWIEQLYAEGITGGCSVDPLLYCPASPNLRREMAVFLTKTFLSSAAGVAKDRQRVSPD